jgi:hypothetical protein
MLHVFPRIDASLAPDELCQHRRNHRCLRDILFETAPEIAIHRKTDRDTMFLLKEL